MKSGKLPSVSWIVPPLAECEHPAAPPERGEYLVQQILRILLSDPDVWAQTVFIKADLNALTGTLDVGLPYPLPASNSMPAQETTPARPPVP